MTTFCFPPLCVFNISLNLFCLLYTVSYRDTAYYTFLNNIKCIINLDQSLHSMLQNQEFVTKISCYTSLTPDVVCLLYAVLQFAADLTFKQNNGFHIQPFYFYNNKTNISNIFFLGVLMNLILSKLFHQNPEPNGLVSVLSYHN